MIPADLLDQLREKDPELWMEITRTELAEIEYCDVDGDECEPDYIYWAGLRSEAQDAWLQHCLQDAIRARKWLATVLAKSDESNHRCLARLDSEDDEIETVVEYGSTEAEALCLAYLEAIEAIRP